MTINALKHQGGMVLLVSLILLLATSVIALSSMETSVMEKKMSTSRELKELSFQTTEAAIEEALDDLGYIGQAFAVGQAGGTSWPTETYSFNHDSELSASSEVRFIDRAPTEGYSIRKGASGIETYYFEVEATGTRQGTPISSEHLQGFFVEGPRIE